MPSQTEGPTAPVTARSSRKQNRQDEARRRRLLKPHTDKVKKIDQQMKKLRLELDDIEARLADESLYTDESRKAELPGLMQAQGSIRAQLDSLEWDWLAASEQLEEAERELG